MPSSRASTAMANENCWQYPFLVLSRKVVRLPASVTVGAVRVYLKVPLASQSCRATASWNAVFAPAALTTVSARFRSGSYDEGTSR